MAKRAALTPETLTALGAEKLASLILEETGRNPAFKVMATAAVASAAGPQAVAAIVDRRLAGLERARGFVDWDKRKAFAADLRATLVTIRDDLGPADPRAGVDRLVRFLGCAGRVYNRIDDSSGAIQAVFSAAVEALPGLAARLPDGEAIALVERLVAGLAADDTTMVETAVGLLLPRLPAAALTDVDRGLAQAAAALGSPKTARGRDWASRVHRDRLVRLRQVIADLRHDVDAFIALEREEPDAPPDALAIAERLLGVGRSAEALDWVRRPLPVGLRVVAMDKVDIFSGTDLWEGERVRLEVRILIALGRKPDAQHLRWQTFAASLDPAMLRAYLADLGDFEEFDAMERAVAAAFAHPSPYQALGFLTVWPRLDLAATLVIERRTAWDGQSYELLRPAAEALEALHPVAATILYRALLDDILTQGRSQAYGYAARYLKTLDGLPAEGLAAAGLDDPETYRAALKRTHARKHGFWTAVAG